MRAIESGYDAGRELSALSVMTASRLCVCVCVGWLAAPKRVACLMPWLCTGLCQIRSNPVSTLEVLCHIEAPNMLCWNFKGLSVLGCVRA